MFLGIDKLGANIKEQYDKAIALVVLLVLVTSLVYLGVKIGSTKQCQKDFDAELHSCVPAHLHASKVEPKTYKEALAALDNPFIMPQCVHTNGCGSMFVPQTRFNCKSCRRPVRMGDKECPFCQAKIVYKKTQNPDPDGDGMPTVWENKYKLDPFDSSDAVKDNDNDGYTNLEEYKDGTNPTDPTSHPAAVERLKLKSITGKKFGLRFKSRIKTGSGYKFSLNYRLPNGEIKTDFVKIGDKVASVTIHSYTPKEIKDKHGFKKDVSELVVVTEDGEKIVLVMGKATLHVKLIAHLVLPMHGGKEKRFDVSNKDVFELEGAKYKVIDIDSTKRRVIISPTNSHKKIVIQGTPPTNS